MTAATRREPIGQGNEIELEGVAVGLDRDDRKAVPERKKSINIAHKNAGFLDLFARTNIIYQIGVFVSEFPEIP
ncbi:MULTISPECIES: hypothetical protein [unclassified Pseudomonas]|uniref:hypothetical protein n=1 Tax=unclassified Pseudomonas TaxID=196821 RepID=UPI0021148F4D|nr:MULTISPECIES: hypothetical protein [unclassified Pseudomonas]